MPYDVQGVLFDLDDTLLDHSATASAAILHLVRSVPDWTDDDTTTVTRWRDLETEHLARYTAGDAPDDALDDWFDACRPRNRRRRRTRAPAQPFGLAPEQVLMVGDHRINDVDGARAAGLHAVPVSADPARRPTTDSPEVVETIAGITDLRLRP